MFNLMDTLCPYFRDHSVKQYHKLFFFFFFVILEILSLSDPWDITVFLLLCPSFTSYFAFFYPLSVIFILGHLFSCKWKITHLSWAISFMLKAPNTYFLMILFVMMTLKLYFWLWCLCWDPDFYIQPPFDVSTWIDTIISCRCAYSKYPNVICIFPLNTIFLSKNAPHAQSS